MTQFKYINNYYGVNACIGRIVKVDGKPGVIAKDCGHYLGVNFDSDKPGVISNCHPTWEVEYFGVGKVRKLTKAQERGQRWLEYGDMFESFMDFVYWDMREQKL
jgi:hypothetical protein